MGFSMKKLLLPLLAVACLLPRISCALDSYSDPLVDALSDGAVAMMDTSLDVDETACNVTSAEGRATGDLEILCGRGFTVENVNCTCTRITMPLCPLGKGVSCNCTGTCVRRPAPTPTPTPTPTPAPATPKPGSASGSKSGSASS